MASRELLMSVLLEELSDNSDLEFVMRNSTAYFMSSSDIIGVGDSIQTRYEPVRVELYAEATVPLYSDIDFKSHFRMKRSTFEILCVAVSPALSCRVRSMTVEKKMLALLWLLGNQESYRSVADRFGISKGTLHLTIISSCKAISSLMKEYITFPETRQQMKAAAEGFQQRCGMPGIIGAVDGTHVPIPGPTTEHRASFINRKGFPSMILQVICDSNLQFIDIYTGWPGSVHDARVFRNSPVANKIDNLPDEFHVLGDSAYPLKKHVLVPYRDNGHLDHVEKKFNKAHSSTRVDVERAIGLLKCKFRRLKYLDMKLEHEIPVVISACCVLHNFILREEKDLECFEVDSENLGDDGSGCGEHEVGNADAEAKRRCIANCL